MPGSILGTRVTRTEDPELLLGEAKYIADLDLGPQTVHVVFVRSEVAHANIVSVDAAEAMAMPGVVTVYTAETLGLAPAHSMGKVHDRFGRPPLAIGKVRFVGEAVAAVVATSGLAARDAAATVVVDYDVLPSTTDAEAAMADGAAVLFDDHGSNVALTKADPELPDIFDGADVVVRGRYVNSRMAVVAMEPHGVAAEIADDGRVVVHGSTQMPHLLQMLLMSPLGLTKEQLRVVTPPVGGGFGGKAGSYPEQIAIAKMAMLLNRPVKWIATRTEDVLVMSHSRNQVQYAELGCTADGRFTGLRARVVGDTGAYPGLGAFLVASTHRMASGNYAIPQIQFDYAVAATNTTPGGAYRGAGRPEATALIERLVDQAARELGIDPIELRVKNFLPNDVFPFTTHSGAVYDIGNYELPIRRVAELADYAGLRAQQAERRASGSGKQLGIGVSAYVEITAGGGPNEYGSITVETDGSATLLAGTSAHGQGHQTTFAMIVNELTGIPVDKVRLAAVDTDVVRSGGGTGGSRSIQLGGSAVHHATEAMVAKAKRLAAHLLEAAESDIVVDAVNGSVGVAGVPSKALTWAELSAAAAASANSDDDPVDHGDGTAGLAAQVDFFQKGATFPFGAHIAVVEVDTDTGKTTLLRHIAVDDCGTVINPLLVEGQQHGGAAAGISQVMYEMVRYDAAGNPLTANLADYAMPSAAEFPSFEVHSTETPTPLNPLGAKGIGEATTIGATPAVQNAIIDAVSHLGVRHIDMPCTPETVWQAVQVALNGGSTDSWREPPAVFATLRNAVDDVDAATRAASEAAADGV